jgi:hypothetical protein
MPLIWGSEKAEYFLIWGWTTQITLRRLAFLQFCRTRRAGISLHVLGATMLSDGVTRKRRSISREGDATGYKGPDHLLQQLFGREVALRVGRVWGFDKETSELRNMWRRTGQAGLWFTGGSFSQARIYSRLITLQIDAIEDGRLGKRLN